MNQMTHAADHWRRLPPAGLLLVLACVQAAAAPPEPTLLTGRTMGTTYRLKYWGEGQLSPREVQDSVDGLLAEFDRQMSTYRPDSELSRFNRAPADEWFPVSAATAEVVAKAIELHRMSGGAYDVTVAPALRLWNFGPGATRNRQLTIPSTEQLEAARQFVGAQRLHVRADPPALRKDVDGLEVDLSSIAPGYAVDLLMELLANAGFANAVVEIGGEVRAAGVSADGNTWRVGVEKPATQPPTLSQIVPLRDLALSTSGDYRNYRTAGGQRYAHVMDPRTLRPLPYRGMSVTVLAPTCAEADALGTALLVLGPEAGRQWCLEHNVAALFQYRVDDNDSTEVVRITAPRFDELAPPPAQE